MSKLHSTLASALFSAAASLAALTAALPTQALAAMPGATVSVAVETSDLDLRSATDQARLERRLRIAAAEACGDASSADPAGKRAVRQCRAQLVQAGQAQALAAIGNQQRLAAR